MTALVDSKAGEFLDPARCPRMLKTGKQCGNPAGKQTVHAGFGYCHRHGGNAPQYVKHAAKLAAVARMQQDGGEIDVNPLDALLYTVRRASWLAAYYRAQHEAQLLAGAEPEPYAGLERAALADLNSWAAAAVRAGVAERQVRIAERMGERLSAAFENALGAMVAAGLEITAEQRMAAVRTYAGELARAEGGEIEASGSDA
jgi:hypothetical protein